MAELEEVFARRASKSVLDMDELMEARKLTKEMLDDLKKMIRDYPADEYMAAKNFLNSLSLEAGRQTG